MNKSMNAFAVGGLLKKKTFSSEAVELEQVGLLFLIGVFFVSIVLKTFFNFSLKRPLCCLTLSVISHRRETNLECVWDHITNIDSSKVSTVGFFGTLRLYDFHFIKESTSIYCCFSLEGSLLVRRNPCFEAILCAF